MHYLSRLIGGRAVVFAALALASFLHAHAATEANQPETVAVAVPETGPNRVENSVVRVFSTRRLPDLGKPWSKQAASEVSGTGVIIEGNRILTNAHVVLYASQVQVQGSQSGDKLSARVEAIAPGIDLAVLKVEDDSFFTTRPPLPRANTLPEVKDPIIAIGYPTGGSSLSITKGIVSRIEFANYNYSVAGLRIQIDAAINPGNSGGPAVMGDKMIGLAFSTLSGAQNIGYIIPCEEIELFLQDIADGHYDGKPAMYDGVQTLENPALRASLKLDKSVGGVVVREPYGSSPDYPLKPWDIITKIGDTPIDDQGKVKLGASLQVSYLYQVQKIAQNGKLPLTVVRGGKEVAVTLPVPTQRARVLPNLQGNYPDYFIYGPMVFASGTEDFMNALTSGTNSGTVHTSLELSDSPLATRRGAPPAFAGEELVIVPSPFFPHKLSTGYSSPAGQVVKAVNGIAVKNLRHLVEILRDAKDDYVSIEFSSRFAEKKVFPRQEMAAATEEVLNDNGVRAQGSPDMLAVWNTKTVP